MTTGTYLAFTAQERLALAQAEIDQHVYTVRGFCASCREPAPCAARQAASGVFARYHQLPRRRPGLALRGRNSGEDMAIEHQVRRPQWLCATDGEEWPCDGARKLLKEAYRADPGALVRYLAHFMVQAAADLELHKPSTLYRRFMGWTLSSGEACRVCGRPNHTVVAGLPPRLFPCDGLRLPAE